jgi:hypothetical protein
LIFSEFICFYLVSYSTKLKVPVPCGQRLHVVHGCPYRACLIKVLDKFVSKFPWLHMEASFFLVVTPKRKSSLPLCSAPGRRGRRIPRLPCTPARQPAWPVTSLFQLDDGCAWSEAIPGSAVVVGLEIGLYDIVDGECGQHPTAQVCPLHCIAFQGPHLQEVLLPCPGLGWRGQEEGKKDTGGRSMCPGVT